MRVNSRWQFGAFSLFFSVWHFEVELKPRKCINWNDFQVQSSFEASINNRYMYTIYATEVFSSFALSLFLSFQSASISDFEPNEKWETWLSDKARTKETCVCLMFTVRPLLRIMLSMHKMIGIRSVNSYFHLKMFLTDMVEWK